jgi:glycosyltransferase involved in cell wall biosynthesis
MKQLTIIIAEHNEGSQLLDTLNSLYETSDRDLYDVIVVSDGSTVEAKDTGAETRIHLERREGVGAAFDVGMEKVKTPYAIIMGSDIRFIENRYIEKMLGYLRQPENHKSVICTANVGINANRMDFDKGYRRYGAMILFFLKAQDLPPKGSRMARLKGDAAVESYRNIIEAKWMPCKDGEGLYELPCVLGAFYGVYTPWYKYIRGFRGHRYWGSLEPLISLKSWFAGGDCKCASDIEVAHIFKQQSSHVTATHDLLYNKMVISRIVFDEDVGGKFIDFLKGRPEYPDDNLDMRIANIEMTDNKEIIDKEREVFRKIQERDIYWFKKKFPFKDYGVL